MHKNYIFSHCLNLFFHALYLFKKPKIMKTALACLLILVLFTCPVFADNLFIEGGGGIGKSLDSQIFLLKYQKETSRLFGLPSYYEWLLAYWSGEARDEAIGVSRAISFEIAKEQYFSPTLGLLAIRSETQHLGTHFQFYFRLAYDLKVKRRDISFAIVHISNGKLIFRWDGPNTGENFLTLSIGLF